MPSFEAFMDAGSYYATLAHETTHWTKHPSCLDREFGRKNGAMKPMPKKSLSPSWARPSFAPTLSWPCSRAKDHAAYIAHWLATLQNDKRAIFRAAAHAQRAADYIHDLQPPAVEHAA